MIEISVAGGRRIALNQGECVLDALLREGEVVPHACRVGVCQSCLMRGTPGRIPAEAQHGLKETLKVQGFFLACLCYPKESIEVVPAGAELNNEARIEDLRLLNDTVIRVRLRVSEGFSYYPGQFVVLQRHDGLARSYSLASLPEEGLLELHVRRVPGGKMSTWLFEQAQVGESVLVRGPSGSCFYSAGNPEQPLLLAGTGTGLAPLYGIVRDALRQGHSGPLVLYHGARVENDLYLVDELLELQQRHPQLRYHPVVLDGPAVRPEGRVGSLDALVLRDVASPKGMRSYLCGNPALVKSLQKKLFLAGQSLKEILADAFLPSAG